MKEFPKSAPPSPDLKARKLSRENTSSLRGSKSSPELRNLFYHRTDAGSEAEEQRYLILQKYPNTKLVNPGESSHSDKIANQNISSKQEKLAPNPKQLRQELAEMQKNSKEKREASNKAIKIVGDRVNAVKELLSKNTELQQIKSMGDLDLTEAGAETEKELPYNRVYYIQDNKLKLEEHLKTFQEMKQYINTEINEIPFIPASTINEYKELRPQIKEINDPDLLEDFDTSYHASKVINDFHSLLRKNAETKIQEIDTSIDMINKALQYAERWKFEADAFSFKTTFQTNVNEKREVLEKTIKTFDAVLSKNTELQQIKSMGDLDLTEAGAETEKEHSYSRVYYIRDSKSKLEKHLETFQEMKQYINTEIPFPDSTVKEYEELRLQIK